MEFDHNHFLILVAINEVCTRVYPKHMMGMDYYDFLVSMYIENQRVKIPAIFYPPVQF